MKVYKYIVEWWTKGEYIGTEKWYETHTEAFFEYNRLNAEKARVRDGATGDILAEFGFDEEECD
jgi:hypothetical protein